MRISDKHQFYKAVNLQQKNAINLIIVVVKESALKLIAQKKPM